MTIICLIGVFEYGQAYIGGKTPYEDFLKILQKHLAPDGRIVIAIENKYGLKYFAGCKEDHLGSWFSTDIVIVCGKFRFHIREIAHMDRHIFTFAVAVGGC